MGAQNCAPGDVGGGGGGVWQVFSYNLISNISHIVEKISIYPAGGNDHI